MIEKLQLEEDLIKIGIEKGDTILIHSSFKSLKSKTSTPQDVINTLIKVVGEDGTIIFPTLSYMYVNSENPIFDVNNTKSNVGILPETFRQMKNVTRSLSPTHSCAAIGKNAVYLTALHEHDNSPCGINSPFYKLPKVNGKILFLGCSLDKNTSMHAIEETIKPDYLFDKKYEYTTINNGSRYTKSYDRHYFANYDQKYSRILDILDEKDYNNRDILSANSYLIKTVPMWEKAKVKYKQDNHYFVCKI